MTLEAWKHLGGTKHTHVYGEVLPESMFDMLKTAMCLEDKRKCETPEGLQSLFAERDGVAQAALTAFNAAFSCLAGRLGYEHGSFLRVDDTPWKGTSKRVIFINAVDFDSFWTPIQALLKRGGHGYAPETVVIINGRELE